MKLKFTQFNFINSEDGPWEDSDEGNAIMEESETLFSLMEQDEGFSPSEETVNRVLDFARSYTSFPSRNIRFIDLYMN
jgi:hypothetical protein